MSNLTGEDSRILDKLYADIDRDATIPEDRKQPEKWYYYGYRFGLKGCDWARAIVRTHHRDDANRIAFEQGYIDGHGDLQNQ